MFDEYLEGILCPLPKARLGMYHVKDRPYWYTHHNAKLFQIVKKWTGLHSGPWGVAKLRETVFGNFETDSFARGAMQSVETQLLDSREKFLAYIQARVSDPDLAEDIL